MEVQGLGLTHMTYSKEITLMTAIKQNNIANLEANKPNYLILTNVVTILTSCCSSHLLATMPHINSSQALVGSTYTTESTVAPSIMLIHKFKC